MKMKRILSIIILVAVTLTVTPSGTAQTTNTAALPIITGDFMQGWEFAPDARHNPAAMNAHFREMAGAGIRYMILCDAARIAMVNGSMGIREAYYHASPSLLGPTHNLPWGSGIIENMLTAARDTGIKVFIGLGYDRGRDDHCQTGWWSNNLPLNTSWYQPRAAFNNLIAQDLYDQFKSRFPDTFYGWYFPYEFFNNMQQNTWHFAEFVNINRDFLWDLDPSMPLLISPFFNAKDHQPVENTRIELTDFFSHARFRPGDIFAPQDSVGAGWTTPAQAGDYFRMIRQVLDASAPGVHFWANNENFTPESIKLPPG
jgi:hypothetical protein